ncbi:MAG: indole-3-glycerol phosphate synthase TrpC [Muribaculaceae bacterium]|jgi:indole-3-glycerol phosphate synthase|nr:indole-3-glycerol phosphate synthase TrpC [Muribaculaceae bacterium]
MKSVLESIIANKRVEVEAAKLIISEDQIFEMARQRKREPLSISRAINGNYSGIIAEFKRRSPSKGNIHPCADVREVVPGYEANGAAACSIITDTRYFGGSLADLAIANQYSGIPLLRKDFMIDKYQVAESYIYGADAILLIAAVLSKEEMAGMLELAHYFGMEALVEIHSADEVEKIPLGADLIGVNNRNLHTFVTDVDASFNIFPRLPKEAVKIAESGICSHNDIHKLRTIGYSGFLIGETFMKKDNPGSALYSFLNPNNRQ